MTAPRWLPDGLAAIMLVIACYCAIRPAAAEPFRAHWPGSQHQSFRQQPTDRQTQPESHPSLTW